MRPLEIALVTALVPCALYAVDLSRAGNQFCVVAVVAVSLLACHLMFDGGRWQMIPAYCVGGAVIVYGCMQFYGRTYQPPYLLDFPMAYLAGMAALLLVGAAIALSTALPIFRL